MSIQKSETIHNSNNKKRKFDRILEKEIQHRLCLEQEINILQASLRENCLEREQLLKYIKKLEKENKMMQNKINTLEEEKKQNFNFNCRENNDPRGPVTFEIFELVIDFVELDFPQINVNKMINSAALCFDVNLIHPIDSGYSPKIFRSDRVKLYTECLISLYVNKFIELDNFCLRRWIL